MAVVTEGVLYGGGGGRESERGRPRSLVSQ